MVTSAWAPRTPNINAVIFRKNLFGGSTATAIALSRKFQLDFIIVSVSTINNFNRRILAFPGGQGSLHAATIDCQ
jgi:hypothetical protein